MTDQEKAIKRAAHALADLNTFAAVVTVLEGGHIFLSESNGAVEKIIKIAKAEQQKRLDDYDEAAWAAAS